MKNRKQPPAKPAFSHGSSAPSQRQLRVGELLRAELSKLLLKADLPSEVLGRVSLTITEVRVSPDLKQASIFLIPLGGAIDPAPFLEELSRLVPLIRSQIAKPLSLRFVPELQFFADTRFQESDKIDALFSSPPIARDIGKKHE